MAATPQATKRTSRDGPFVALRHRDFRLLWLGQLVSQAGTQMTVVAISWQLYELTRSPAALGLIGLCRLIPLLIFSLGSGVLADAVDRRKLMLLSQSTLLALAALLASATSFGWVTPPLIYIILTLSSIASTFDLPARQALIPSLVPSEHLTNALSLNVIGWQAATIIGPTLGGLLLALRRNADVVYAIDALSFGAVILSLLCMRGHHRVIAADGARRAVSLGAALDGLRFVRSTPILLWTMALGFVATFFAGAMTLLPIFGISRSFWLSCLMLAGLGAADTVSMVIRSILRQHLTPDELRGRMVSVNQIFFAGGPQLGEIEAGLVAQVLGAPASVLTGGLACVVVVLLVAVRVPQLRQYKDATV